MKPGGGRGKGNAFEREIAADIVKAFRRFGVTKADCYRTPLSGGHRYARESDPGDLVLSARLFSRFPFAVECKRDQRWDWGHLLVPPATRAKKKSWVEDQFVRQACAQADGAFYKGQKTPYPLLVVRRNQEAAIAVLQPFAFSGREFPTMVRDLKKCSGFVFTVSGISGIWKAILFPEFLRIWVANRKIYKVEEFEQR